MNIQSLFQRSKLFYTGVLILSALCILLLLVFGKSVCFISLNSYHDYWLDVIFINYTFIGDGIFSICLIIAFFILQKQKKQGLALLISFIVAGLGAQILKNIFNSPRPKLYFEAGQYLHFIDGVSLANNCSFPSGHTATAFAIATVMVYFINNKKAQIGCLLAAALVGYSRIYLAQHFLLDVLAGAILGTVSGLSGIIFAINAKQIKVYFGKIQLLPARKKNAEPITVLST